MLNVFFPGSFINLMIQSAQNYVNVILVKFCPVKFLNVLKEMLVTLVLHFIVMPHHFIRHTGDNVFAILAHSFVQNPPKVICHFHLDYFATNFIFPDVELSLPQGVYLFLGYSTKDESLLKAVTGQGVLETIGAIQGLVSYHNINSNKVH